MYFVSITFLIMSLNLSLGLNCSREIGAEETTKIEGGVIKRSLSPTTTPDILSPDPVLRFDRNESEVFLNPVVRLILLRHKNASQDIWADVIDVVGGELRHRVSDYLNEIWPESRDIENGTESSWEENEEVELGDIEIEAISEREAVIESDVAKNVSRLSALINGHNRTAHDRVARLALSEETRRLIARHINELSPLETAVFVPLHVTLRLLEEADLVAEIPVDGRKRSLMSTAFSVGQVFSVIRNIPDRLRSAWYKAKDIETQCMFR